jgi:hypothetical protein
MRIAPKAARHIALVTVVLIALCSGVHAAAQVRSVTLGVTTHCPYGIMGCWAEIRDGLERPTDIVAINQKPDTRTDTCEVRMREGWPLDPDIFWQNFTNMHIGVDVRGVEMVVEGTLESIGTNLVLRVGGTEQVLSLAPLTSKVQWDARNKRPAPPSRAERKAFDKLTGDRRRHSGRVQLTGPVTKHPVEGVPDASVLVLEVRRFEFLKPSS